MTFMGASTDCSATLSNLYTAAGKCGDWGGVAGQRATDQGYGETRHTIVADSRTVGLRPHRYSSRSSLDSFRQSHGAIGL